MTEVASEDSVRRAFAAMDEKASEGWMKRRLKASYEPLLEELDMDSTVKPLYGHQQDAKLGYNPTKPGRPSHVYHSYFIANLRVVLEVEVQAGNQTAALYAQPELWALLDGLEQRSRPVFLRGDCNWGTERAMEGAETRNIPYVVHESDLHVSALERQSIRLSDRFASERRSARPRARAMDAMELQ